ncbi:MAG: universal stress protein, partial [Myxococcota bacterium]
MDVRKVLVTTDFSDAGNAALRVGHDLAKRYEAHLTLLYVQEGKRSIADGVLPHTSHGKAIDRSATLQNHLEMVAEQLQAEADEYAVLTDTSPT